MTRSINAHSYDTDKPTFDVYFRNYERVFGPFAEREISLLELGINQGGSLRLWCDFFPRGIIAGIDERPVKVEAPDGRIRVYQGLQQDTNLLDRVRAENAPGGFDIIIDDCSHIGEFTASSFWHLFERHLRPGGVYVIEDWGTGYMAGWPDGKRYNPQKSMTSFRSRFRPIVASILSLSSVRRSPLLLRYLHAVMNRLVRMNFRSHQRGLVGFVKQLVDEAGMEDISHPPHGTSPYRQSKFTRIEITHGQVFIVKADAASDAAH